MVGAEARRVVEVAVARVGRHNRSARGFGYSFIWRTLVNRVISGRFHDTDDVRAVAEAAGYDADLVMRAWNLIDPRGGEVEVLTAERARELLLDVWSQLRKRGSRR